MGSGQAHPVLRFLHRITAKTDAAAAPDTELLVRFAVRRDEAAFAALVRRYGPMVLGVCRRVLHDVHDAEDAFQATFLVLVSRAGSVGQPELLGNWLYGVAQRTALRARADATRRRAREVSAFITNETGPSNDAEAKDLRRTLDEELGRLSPKYRMPVVLCYLEGRTQEEAARRLGCPRKTVTTRLARACERLRVRLSRRGVALSAGTAAAVLANSMAASAVPPALTGATLKTAGLFAAGLASTHVATLTKEVLRAMFTTRLKKAAALVLAAGVLATAFGVYLFRTQAVEAGQSQQPGRPAAAKEAAGLEAADKPSDQTRFQGTWTLVAAEVGGKKATQDELRQIGGKALFAGDKAVIHQGGKVEEVHFKIDSTKQPKEMNLVAGFTEVHQAIYQLEGDTLTICKTHPPETRPTAFATKAGAKWPMLLVFKKTAESDHAKLQGTWTIVSVEAGGKPDDKVTKGKIIFSKDTMTHVHPDGKKRPATFKLDPTKTLKEMDATALDGPNKDATFPAIYELEGDSLKLCVAGTWSRPTGFATEPGRKLMLYVLKRDKE